MLKNRVRGLFCPFRRPDAGPIKTEVSHEFPVNDTASNAGGMIVIAYLVLIVILSLSQIISAYAQTAQTISGKVTDERGEALAGAIIKLKGTTLATSSGKEGTFRINSPSVNPTLIISFIGYQPQESTLKPGQTFLSVSLNPDSTQLNEVQIVSTGYQQIPKERATGSFVQIDSALLNRKVSTNILDRLDGVASGVLFNTRTESSYELLNIRGRSTLLTNGISKGAADPLIVLDNFPYEGDISSINPNDIESITILKDAAAASIWGARSGNGVIVLTSKKAKAGVKPQIEFTGNVSLGRKPDLYYNRNFLPAADFIEVERYLYGKGYFNSDIQSAYSYISPVVAVLSNSSLPDAEKEAILGDLKNRDVRDDQSRFRIQSSLNQQYNLALRGAESRLRYAVSVGYDKNRPVSVRNSSDRVTVNTLNTYTPFKNFSVTGGILYTRSGNADNNYVDDSPSSNKYATLPYTRWTDDEGNPAEVSKSYKDAYKRAMEAKGLRNWAFRPLDELSMNDRSVKLNNLLLRLNMNYNFKPGWAADLSYQYQSEGTLTRDFQNPDSYKVRDYINRYAQIDAATGKVTFIFPQGGMLTQAQSNLKSESLRGQMSFNRDLGTLHAVSALAGLEFREARSDGFDRTYYGYDDEYGTSVTNLNFQNSYTLNPTGTAVLPPLSNLVSGTLNRYFSVYVNGSYTYDSRYTASFSARRDGSNIFGVNTNDKITPLWSAGLAWNIAREGFYSIEWLPQLKLRATYGFNGNVYNASAFLTAKYSSTNPLGLPYSNITRAPNPDLRWERVKNINIGIDFATRRNRLSGTVELYRKEGLDLIEEASLAPSTGFTSFMGNAAAVRTKGMDFTLNSRNVTGAFSWSSSLLFSAMKDEVTDYDPEYSNSILTASYLVPVKGRSLFGVYSYRWGGLDPQTGDPYGYYGGQLSKDWQNIVNNTPADSLVYSGSSRPRIFGSLMNTFSWKGFSISANIVYKFSYFFRRTSTVLSMDKVLLNPHRDYALRWQQPGDELRTSVPSIVYPNNDNRSSFYNYSDALIEKGDHIRLQDLRIAYSLAGRVKKRLPFSSASLFMYMNNLGILWKANKQGIDPDFYNSSYKAPLVVSFGVKAGF